METSLLLMAEAELKHMAGRAFHKGAGCQQCHNSGYKGRIGVYEVLEMTVELRRMVHRAAATHELREKWRQQGGVTLREEGIAIALAGRSDLEEVLRVTQDEDKTDVSGQARDRRSEAGGDAAPAKDVA